jgi:hypothetical protein
MKPISSALGLILCLFSLMSGAAPAVLQGKVHGATGTLAPFNGGDCQVKVLSQSADELHIDFYVSNAQGNLAIEQQNLALTKDGRYGLLEKMAYDFGLRTAPQPLNDIRVLPPAFVQYSHLIKVKNAGARIEYKLSELRSNGEFYRAESDLYCSAQ